MFTVECLSKKPFVDGAKILRDGKVENYTGRIEEVTSPIIDPSTGGRTVIGRVAMFTEDYAVAAVESAQVAWNKGRGEWPQLSMANRIGAIMNLVSELKSIRAELTNVFMWEICKNATDSAAEFDRTILFIEAVITAIGSMDAAGDFKLVSGVMARVRRAAIGVNLILGPFNYPFNETYTALIPALLMGNVVVMKIPKVGGLAHILTMEAFARNLPPGVVNFITGSGRETLGPAMRTGVIDMFSFIGGSEAANSLIKEHPHPHRLKVWLSMEGKNLGIVTADANVDVAAEQRCLGATAFNGQRCTAIKLIFVHRSIAVAFLDQLVERVNNLKSGLPWEEGVLITPLPEHNKTAYLSGLIDDAVGKGAEVVNIAQGGGSVEGALMKPAVVFPVTRDMRLWHEEQFGPVVPVAVFDDIAEVEAYITAMPFGQQAAIFTTQAATAAPLIDLLSTAVGRININTQCGRSPDVFPFSGRRSSALGTLSVTEAINTFSIETVVAFKHSAFNEQLVHAAEELSAFLSPL